MDYSPLRDALQQGNFQQADDLTRANLIKLAGPDAEKKGWVYFSEVNFIPATDLQTIDKLWRAATNNRCVMPRACCSAHLDAILAEKGRLRRESSCNSATLKYPCCPSYNIAHCGTCINPLSIQTCCRDSKRVAMMVGLLQICHTSQTLTFNVTEDLGVNVELFISPGMQGSGR